MNQAVQTGLRRQALRTRVGEAWGWLAAATESEAECARASAVKSAAD